MSTATTPQPRTAYQAWRNLADAIKAGTDLVPTRDDPFAGANQPASVQHRQFQVQPGDARYHGRCAPGEALGKKLNVTIRLTHSYDPHQHEASWQLASRDFERLEDAVLTRAEAFKHLQPEPIGATARREGHFIVQTLTVSVTYSRPLPDLSGE